MAPREGRPWWHPRRGDILFLIGAVGFVVQLLKDRSDPTIVFGSLALMGLPVLNRIDK